MTSVRDNKILPAIHHRQGFTLIELSIVLVIIGLIIGGILTGQDLINAATLRAQISQIEKYNTAVRTFQGKYGYLPGDIPDPQASNFGFIARGPYAGEGDGNGVLETTDNCGWGDGISIGTKESIGETVIFWRDLSTANLIEGGFNSASLAAPAAALTLTSTPNINTYLPPAKINNASYVYAWSGGWQETVNGPPNNGDGTNYYGISAVTQLSVNASSCRMFSNPSLTVQQASNIDSKIDDGLPQTGNVLAIYINGNYSPFSVWAAGTGIGNSSSNAPTTSPTSYTATTCYDNNNTNGIKETYSLKNANILNCALSFRFQ